MKLGKVLIVFGALFLVLGLTETATADSEAIFPSILFIIIGVVLLLKPARNQDYRSDYDAGARRREYKATRKEFVKRFNETVNGKHVEGLPIAKGASCTAYFSDNRVTITGSEAAFEIARSQIMDVAVRREVNDRKTYVNTFRGAIAGDAVLGDAVIGSGIGAKSSSNYDYYLIITYTPAGSDIISYVSMEVFDRFKAENIADKYRMLSGTTRVLVKK